MIKMVNMDRDTRETIDAWCGFGGAIAFLYMVFMPLGYGAYLSGKHDQKIQARRNAIIGEGKEVMHGTLYDANKDGRPDFIEVNGVVYRIDGVKPVGRIPE